MNGFHQMVLIPFVIGHIWVTAGAFVSQNEEQYPIFVTGCEKEAFREAVLKPTTMEKVFKRDFEMPLLMAKYGLAIRNSIHTSN
jgi:hypothetical protein